MTQQGRTGWTTLSPHQVGWLNSVVVTGGKEWTVTEDPARDWSHLPREEAGDLVFVCGDEVRRTVKTRWEDLVVWHQ